MKYIYKSITILFIAFCCFRITAQTNTMNFTFQSDSVIISGENFTTDSVFSKTGNTLVWTQVKNGIIDAMNFSITSSSGSWDQVTSQGNINYVMNFDNYQCDFIVSSQNSNLTVTLTFNLNGTQVDQYIFNVDTISYQ